MIRRNNRIKIVFIGAGSIVFARNLIADFFAHESLAGCRLELVDIDRERLETAGLLAESIKSAFGVSADIHLATDRRRALDGADFVISAIGVGGYPATKIDHEIPASFGVGQVVGDTLGPGGIFRSLRSVPVLLEICREMEQLCPDALLLNYSNPMATHCLAVERATKIKHVGLCHGVCNTARFMRMCIELAEVPPREIEAHFELPPHHLERERQWKTWWELGDDPALSYTCAGINHMAFFLRFESAGKDLYPQFRAVLDQPHILRLDGVRLELFRDLGYFMTETSGHTSEYLPYFLKDRAESDAKHLVAGAYLATCDRQEQSYQSMRRDLQSGRPVVQTPHRLSVEYASRILNAVVTGQPYVFNGNVHNQGGRLISNLPGDACVEVPCVADAAGVRPTFVGELPPQCAALIRTNINVQDLIVRAILEGRRDYVHHAMMLDPNTASILTLSKLRELTAAMLDAQQAWLPANLKSSDGQQGRSPRNLRAPLPETAGALPV